MQATHGMLRSKMKEIKWEEAYLVEKVHCPLCLFELQKSHKQSFMIFKWKEWSRINGEGRASYGENAFKLQNRDLDYLSSMMFSLKLGHVELI